MEASFLLIADYANVTDTGKINVMGIFTTIHASVFPVRHPEMYVITQLNAGSAEYGRAFKLGLKLVNEDGTELMNIPVDLTVPQGKKGQRVNLNHILRLQSVLFPKPGIYEFSVLIDNDVKRELPIEVKVMEQHRPNET